MVEQTPNTSFFEIGGNSFPIQHIDGRAFREGVFPQLGKRLVCGMQVDISKEAEDGTKTTVQHLLKGNIETNDELVYVGCGTELLTLKPSKEHMPLCCNIPMSLSQPKVLPSAD